MRQEQQRQWSYDLPFGRVVITFNDGVYMVKATSPLWTCTFACSSCEIAYQEALSLVARIGNIKKVTNNKDATNEHIALESDQEQAAILKGEQRPHYKK